MSGKKVPTYAPNQSLYITNIPGNKIQKQDIRRSLYTLFSTYGPVLDVVALRTVKMRGQAHVVYRDVQTATQAMRALQGFEFFGLEMQIQYAKSKSHTIAKLDGTFQMPAAEVGAVTSTELQRSIFNAPPSASTTANTTSTAPGLLKPPSGADHPMDDAKSPTTSVAGQKRRRDEEEEDDSEEDVAMEEDSDDD
ncbi:RNA-binding, RBD [Glarea lozoyensis ATCC 20868]|uniref:RNA-binding, RBD n=1 Tax=Glarea lozoyensis (strain ATCC 20868 / MF5171) TaxID=1116229 RepID=S3DCP9_GLAL2|nr:RNA-binding, RBD [Glarea lozoyensis ATCC 20868]EPE35510.1 RNA-binding, RBD [Glarea lozoyensis ATCC 20868]